MTYILRSTADGYVYDALSEDMSPYTIKLLNLGPTEKIYHWFLN